MLSASVIVTRTLLLEPQFAFLLYLVTTCSILKSAQCRLWTSTDHQHTKFREFDTDKLVKELSDACKEARETPSVKLYRLTPQLAHLEAIHRKVDRGCNQVGLLTSCQIQRQEVNVQNSPPVGTSYDRSFLGAGPLGWLWHTTFGSGLSDVRLSQERAKEALSAAYSNDTTASPEVYQRSLGSHGDPPRLRRVLRRLVAGQAIKVVMVGGSVTVGMGASTRNDSYPQLVLRWLSSLQPAGAPPIQMVNSAVSATTSSYASQCVSDFVPQDADLVFVEYSVNDWEVLNANRSRWMDNGIRRGFERLMRKVLQLPHVPAIILLHWWSPLHFHSSYWNVAEDQLDVIGGYYGLQSISFRNAYYHDIMTGTPGFRLEDIFCDVVHPNNLGHRYFADLVIYYLQNALASALLTPNQWGPLHRSLPPPMFKGNSRMLDGKCLKGEAFRSAVVSAKGFRWVNEAKAKAPQPKWGYVGVSPGEQLVVQVGHGRRVRGINSQARNKLVALGFLRSYEGMGWANVSCGPTPAPHPKDCSCSPALFDTHHEHHVSQVYWNYVLVRAGADCLLYVTIANQTSSGGHKVKVTSLLVSDDVADDTRMFSVLNATDAEGDNSG
eukprot:jgi/Botrbrau1/17694/Bobra.0166s0118.1